MTLWSLWLAGTIGRVAQSEEKESAVGWGWDPEIGPECTGSGTVRLPITPGWSDGAFGGIDVRPPVALVPGRTRVVDVK